MENREEQILNDFLAKNKKEIDDNGFSGKVIQKLPVERNIRWILPVFTLLGIIIAVLQLNLQRLLLKLYFFIIQIPIGYLAIIFFAIPFVVLALWYMNEKKHWVFG